MHFNVKNVLQLDEALHELPIHDSGITSIENEVGNKELLIHLSNLSVSYTHLTLPTNSRV